MNCNASRRCCRIDPTPLLYKTPRKTDPKLYVYQKVKFSSFQMFKTIIISISRRTKLYYVNQYSKYRSFSYNDNQSVVVFFNYNFLKNTLFIFHSSLFCFNVLFHQYFIHKYWPVDVLYLSLSFIRIFIRNSVSMRIVTSHYEKHSTVDVILDKMRDNHMGMTIRSANIKWQLPSMKI